MLAKHNRRSHHRHHTAESGQGKFPPLIAALLAPACYPHPVAEVSLVETHISYLLLAGEYAYKIKKPVNLGFLDFTSLDRRRFFCEEELRLNRRTAPDLYLDVLAVTGSETAPTFGGNGPIIEYALRMRRFPQEALLDHLARQGDLSHEHIDALAAVVARFHAEIARGAVDEPAASSQAVIAPALQNFDQVCALLSHGPGLAAMDALREWTEGEFAARAKCIGARGREGFVRECHGDLHLGNVALIDGVPMPFDCIEFNAQFRWIDVMNEIAFMVMDLLDHDLPRFAFRFLNGYLEITGDYAGLRVLRFYLVYRAMVRAKVALIRARQSGSDEAEADFVHHVALANSLSASARPALILMHGVSGSGKSTVARVLAERLGAVRLRSDVERKRLHGLTATVRTGADTGSGIYATDETERTYARLADLAAAGIETGWPMIVDATCLRRGQRDRFRALAADAGAPFVIVACCAPDDLLRRRVAQREREGADASEAGLAVLERQCETRDPLGGDELTQAIVVDTEIEGDGFEAPVASLGARLGFTAHPA